MDASALDYAYIKCSISKVDVLNTITCHIMHLFLRGTWLDVAPRMDIKITCI